MSGIVVAAGLSWMIVSVGPAFARMPIELTLGTWPEPDWGLREYFRILGGLAIVGPLVYSIHAWYAAKNWRRRGVHEYPAGELYGVVIGGIILTYAFMGYAVWSVRALTFDHGVADNVHYDPDGPVIARANSSELAQDCWPPGLLSSDNDGQGQSVPAGYLSSVEATPLWSCYINRLAGKLLLLPVLGFLPAALFARHIPLFDKRIGDWRRRKTDAYDPWPNNL